MVITLPLERLSRHYHAGAWERENEKTLEMMSLYSENSYILKILIQI